MIYISFADQIAGHLKDSIIHSLIATLPLDSSFRDEMESILFDHRFFTTID